MNPFVRLLAVSLTISLFSACAENGSAEGKSSKKAVRTGHLKDVRSGDLVVKRGRGHLSNMIVKKLDEEVPLSHCGIISRERDSIFIIHSVARELTGIDGVQKISYQEFIKDCVPGYFYVVRYKGREDVNEQIERLAREYLDKKVPFDYEINYYDKNRVNCSELLLQIIRETEGRDVFQKVVIDGQKVAGFNSLLDTSNFQVIYSY